jgi:predicted phosphodiesterase
MIRRQTNQPSAILTSDWHLRETNPVCRTDNYWNTQWRKVDFISDLQKQYDCLVLHAGDLFDHWKPSPFLLSETIRHLPNKFYTVYGQHDLPQHNLELSNKSGIYTLEMADKLWAMRPNDMFEFCSWNEQPCNIGEKVLVWHIHNYQGKQPWPDCPSPTASKLLKKYPQYDLIVTGDNHMPFVEEYEGRLLVNPGSLMRMDADQINHRPRVYLWYAETNTVTPVYIPIEPAAKIISREHIELKAERDKRIEEFVNRLSSEWEVSISFEENLKRFQKMNNVRTPIMEIIYKAIEL